MFNDYDEILTCDEACELLHVGKNAIYKLLNEKKIKAFKNGHIWRIPKKAVVDYIMETSKIKL